MTTETKTHHVDLTETEARAVATGELRELVRPVEPSPEGKGPGGYPVPITASYGPSKITGKFDFQSADGATQEIMGCPFGRPGDVLEYRAVECRLAGGHSFGVTYRFRILSVECRQVSSMTEEEAASYPTGPGEWDGSEDLPDTWAWFLKLEPE
jgi:hypothetical protein